MLGSTHKDSYLIHSGSSLGTRNFKSSPDNCDMLPNLRSPGSQRRFMLDYWETTVQLSQNGGKDC